VRERPQVLVFCTLAAEQVTVGVPQASVADGAVWLAQEGTVGLHPKSVPGSQLVNAGAVVSSVHVQVLAQVAEFPHWSEAVQVIVRERPHVLVFTMLSPKHVTVGIPQLSVAEGADTLIQEGIVGLQPRFVPGGQLPNTGALISCTVTG
jgi:hypothetical protein